MTPKRILIFTNHFHPEPFRVNDIAFYLAKKGHKVTVVTQTPNYPTGSFYDGYGVFRRSHEEIDGVEVCRMPVIPRGSGTAIPLGLNYLSYLAMASAKALMLLLRKKFDVVFVHETSPITIGIPAVIYKRLARRPMHFWVLDLWPESLYAAGIENPRIHSFFRSLARRIYHNSDSILISSEGFVEPICQIGNFKHKIQFYPNWAEDIFSENNDSKRNIPLPDGFRILYAGNLGEAQDFPTVLQAALCLRDKPIKWIFAGDGRARHSIEEFIKTHKLEENVILLGKLPLKEMPSLFRRADLTLASLKDIPGVGLTIPAKIQAYMAAGRPILAVMTGCGAEIVQKAEAGFVSSPGDVDSLVKNVMRAASDPDSLLRMGENSRRFYLDNYERNACLRNIEHILFKNI